MNDTVWVATVLKENRFLGVGLTLESAKALVQMHEDYLREHWGYEQEDLEWFDTLGDEANSGMSTAKTFDGHVTIWESVIT